MSNKSDTKKGANMAHRAKTKKGKDKRVFTQTAKKVKKINLAPKTSRGGIRL